MNQPRPTVGVSPESRVRFTGTVTPQVHARQAERLVELCRQLDFWPRHVAEVGVMLPENCEVRPFIEQENVYVDLFEPQPECAAALRAKWGGRTFPRVQIFEVAIGDHTGSGWLCRRKPGHVTGAAHLEGVVPPQPVQASGDRIEVRVELFSKYDHGQYDLVTIDTEGADWLVLKNMVSLPRIVSVEFVTKQWRNPYADKIMQWAVTRGYRHQDHKLDRVFFRE